MATRIRLSQLYGYLACLILLITSLVSVGQIVTSAFDLTDPLLASGYFEQHRALSSVENYRMDVMQRLRDGQPMPDDAAVQAMYESAREAQIGSVRLDAVRTMTASGLLLVVCVVLFIAHWRWLRRIDTRESKPEPHTPAMAA